MKPRDRAINKQFCFTGIEKSFLTIITLTYNSSQYISQCISSLINACCRLNNIKVSHIVVDGYSSDNTIKIIRAISPSSQIFFRNPTGIYDALNHAVFWVKSPYLMYLHSDDEIDELFLSEMFKKINNFKNLRNHIFYGTVDFINKESQLLFSRKPPFYIAAVQRQVPIIFHPNAIYSTVLEKEHPYKTDMGLEADQEHITEIAKKAELIRVPRAKYKFRMSLTSSTINKQSGAKHSRFYGLSLPRIYIRMFENKLVARFFMKIVARKSYWQGE